jgi:hypothetical protein
MSFRKFKSLSKAPVRPAVQLARHLEKNLLAYAAAASAGLLPLSLPAEAEIIYTPCNTPMTRPIFGQPPALTPLDLNNDGAADFSFGMFSNARGSFGSTNYLKFYLNIVPNRAGNAVVQGQKPPTAAAVAVGKKIGPEQQFAVSGRYMALFSFANSATRNSGTWLNVEFAYVGLKFLINGQFHYGWARVKFPSPGDYEYPSIYGYAYESTPNQPILTGQTSGSTEETASVEEDAESPPASLGMLATGASLWRLWRPRNFAVDTPETRPVSQRAIPTKNDEKKNDEKKNDETRRSEP